MQVPVHPNKGFCHFLKSSGESVKGFKQGNTLSTLYLKEIALTHRFA